MAKQSPLESPERRKKLKPQKQPYWLRIAKGRHIGYFVGKTGQNKWLARYETESGNRYQKTIEGIDALSKEKQFNQAQKLALEWIDEHQDSEIGFTVKRSINEYLDHLKREKGKTSRTYTDTKQRLKKHVLNRETCVINIADKQLVELTHDDIFTWRNGVLEGLLKTKENPDDSETTRKSKDTCNRILTMLKAALNFSFRRGKVKFDNQWRTVEPFKKVAASRKIFLSNKQTNKLLESTTDAFHDWVKALLLTGMRPGVEIANLLVENFDYKNKTLEIKTSKTDPRTIYLSDQAVTHFSELAKNKTPRALLIPKDDGSMWGRSHHSRPMDEAVIKAKLPKDTTAYALRHTYISNALRNGLNAQLIAENCGTSIRMIEKHYGKFMKEYRHEEFNKVEML